MKEPGDTLEDGIGQHVFGAGEEEEEEGPGIEESRHLLQDFLCTNRLTLANTLFHKQPAYLITCTLDKAARLEPPYNDNRFSTLDYFMVQQIWKHSVKDVDSHIRAGLDSDNFSFTAEIRVALKAESWTITVIMKFKPCTEAHK